jgi:hypothetical protein
MTITLHSSISVCHPLIIRLSITFRRFRVMHSTQRRSRRRNIKYLRFTRDSRYDSAMRRAHMQGLDSIESVYSKAQLSSF